MSQGIIFSLLLFTGRGISYVYANAVTLLFSLLLQLLYVCITISIDSHILFYYGPYEDHMDICLIWIC